METLSVVQQLEIIKVSTSKCETGKLWLIVCQWLFVEEVVYYTVHVVIKSAFLFFYLRLSPNKTFRICVYAGVALNGMVWIINVYVSLLPSYYSSSSHKLMSYVDSWHAFNVSPLMRFSIPVRIQMRYASTNLLCSSSLRSS
jgi:hypothetical protein